MRLLADYVNYHKKALLLFLVMSAIWCGTSFLFSVPWPVSLYSLLLCSAAGLAVAAWDFLRFRQRHEELQYLEKEITDSMDSMPLPWDLLEQDYQNVVKASFQSSQKLAFDADRRYQDMEDYYTLWVHQIKTPMAAMKLMLQTGELPEEERGRLQNELFRIEQYVEMVLCYLRLCSHTSDYVIREYDLDSVVKQAVRKYASLFIRSRCRLDYKPLQCQVLTDEKWLLFVIEQLLDNALKYTAGKDTADGGRNSGREMGPAVEILLEEPKTLVIRDNGIGIAPEDLPRIFEKGYTGYNGREDRKSTGLGLYLCRQITEKLGHKIWATSQPGVGSEIHIDLESYELQVE